MNTFNALRGTKAEIDPRSLMDVNKDLVCDQTQKLPSELFYGILRLSMMLSPSDFLQKLASVCRHWKKACYTILRAGEIINYTQLKKAYPTTFSINKLIRMDSRINLHNLNFCEFNLISNNEFNKLTSLKRLNKLNISGAAFITKETLRKFTQLTELDASYCVKIGNDAIKEIACLTQLQILHISCFLGIDEDLEPITRLTRLKELTISNFIEFDNNGIGIIAKLNNLSKLSLLAAENDRYEAQELVVHTISQLKNLKSLTLVNCTATTDLIFWGIGRLKQLEHLTFEDGVQLTDITIANIGRLTLLRSLDLSWSCEHITDAGLKKLSRLIHLEDLNLYDSKSISGNVFNIFRQLKRLKLFRSPITDIAIKKMTKLSKLRQLDLKQCHHISYLGLLQIAKLTNLKKLKLYHCKLITPETALKLAQLFNVDDERLLCKVCIPQNSEEGEENIQDSQGSGELKPLRKKGFKQCVVM